MFAQREKLDARLPATPCTPEMRERIVAIANEHGVGIADVQREAFSLFLSGYDSKTINNDTTAIETEKAS